MFRPVLQRLCLVGCRATSQPFAKQYQVSGFFSSMATATATEPHTKNSPSHQLEVVQILRLNNLHDNPGAIKKKRRIGRGIGCSKGKTSGRGHKGQKARSGAKIHPTFEGGQTPLYKLFPKRGFKNTRHAEIMNGINLGTIQTHIAMRRLDPTQPITIAAMKEAGMFKANSVKHGVKLLSTGKEILEHPLTIQVNRASAAAIAAVEAAGGSVVTVHLNRLALRTELRPEKFENMPIPKRARPPPKYQPYYTSYHKRGYLNPAVQMMQWFETKKQNNDSNVTELESKFQELLELNNKKFGVKVAETTEASS